MALGKYKLALKDYDAVSFSKLQIMWHFLFLG